MGALILVLVAVFALSETSQVDQNTTHSTTSVLTQTDMQADEGDIGQIFGTNNRHPETISVIVEEPLAAAPVPCYKTTQLIRDLTVPYSQRTYIRPDGTSCTPVE